MFQKTRKSGKRSTKCRRTESTPSDVEPDVSAPAVDGVDDTDMADRTSEAVDTDVILLGTGTQKTGEQTQV